DYLVFDEPYAFGHKLAGEGRCQWSIDRVAQDTSEFAEAVTRVFPDIVIGGVEPLWGDPAITAADLILWMDAYESAAGQPLDFLHLDVDWSVTDWPDVVVEATRAVRDAGIPVGVIYNGGDAETDAESLALARLHMFQFEQLAEGSADHVIVQSWHDKPDRVLPETDSLALTSLINLYFGQRTALEMSERDSKGPTAKVVTTGGSPVGGVAVTAAATPLSGQVHTLSDTGIVPEGAERALILIRVNTESAGPGLADMALHRVSVETSSGDLVPDGSFADSAWTPYGAGTGTFVDSSDGSGRTLHLAAQPDQDLFVDGSVFDVSAGAGYTLSAVVSIPENSAASGYLALVFLADDAELERHIMPLAPSPISLGVFTTDPSGVVTIPMTDLPSGEYLVVVSFEGDLTTWPSSGQIRWTVG
ncbi:MAG: hypothetical protein WCE80_11840, partial [Acidimicrobiia bacterium]